ncbi:hypothetical protein QA649_12175 [Bradyrhizobium sp. CB1717]|uniref:hypothetical protein n=1 Tax=Bradyrhizobium sp. CB1717 TaxID=3039154 RepID=UPI0024B19EBE|nr:hypothetical protein [Bradyrhizobium sp. CB1717]WFU26921.1 hypothetical protein QA649_12175 [Bradyrhizobium sp. CB1717]
MQLHPRDYLQFISRLWHFRALPPRNRDPDTQGASPLLIYIVVVLALFLVILQADVYQLTSLGLPGNPNGINPIFLSP